MNYPRALNRWGRRMNRRGAVFLLAVYFASLLLLVLGGIALQRTITESRAAGISRDGQQAFFLAEGALDVAVSKLRTSNLPDGRYDQSNANTPELPKGASFTLTTAAAQIINPQTQQVTRQIVASGTTSAASRTITATVSSTGPLKGVWTTGPIWVAGWDMLGGILGMGGTGLLQGDLRSALGTFAAIRLWDNVQHQGQLQIGKSAATTEQFTISHFQEAWQIPSGTDWTAKPGVYLEPFAGNPPPATTGQPTIAPMIPPAPIVSPYTASQCSGNITTTNGQQLTIRHGNLNPKDLSAPNDNVIVLCLQYLQNSAAGAKVIFESPATVYLTGRDGNGYALSSNGVGASAVYTVPPGYLVPDTAPLTPSGLKIIVTKTAGGVGGKVSLYSNRFAGSIYAPESSVDFTVASNGEYRLENIIGRETAILTWGQPLSINNGPANPAAVTPTVSLQSWSSN